MSVHNEIFFAPPEAIPQIVEDLRLILQNHYQVDVQERMSQGYELQVRKGKYLAFLGLSLNKTIYISPATNGKISCEISSGELGELVLPGILAFIFLFVFLGIGLILVVPCAVWGLKVKKDFNTYIFKEVEKFAEQYKVQNISSGMSATPSEHKCSKCGNVLDSPGFCPECGTKVN